jgi:invasion protein IalB
MPVFRKFRALAAGVLVTAAAAALAPADAFAASMKDGDKFGDWTANCNQPPNAKEQICRLIQIEQITDKEGKPVTVLKSAVFRLGPKELVLFAYLPLGFAIAPGVTITIDGAKGFPMYPQRCLPQGCEIALKLDGPFLAQMKKGKQAKVEFQLGDKHAAVPLSLKGFGEGLGKM